jgi:hypothetical protein
MTSASQHLISALRSRSFAQPTSRRLLPTSYPPIPSHLPPLSLPMLPGRGVEQRAGNGKRNITTIAIAALVLLALVVFLWSRTVSRQRMPLPLQLVREPELTTLYACAMLIESEFGGARQRA